MSGIGQLSTTPLQMLQRSLVNAATGMRSGGKTDLLDLRPVGVLKSTVDAIRKSSPRTAAVLSVVVPFALLTYALHEHIWRFFDLQRLIKKVQKYFLSSIVIQPSHPMRDMCLDWIAENTDARGNSASLHETMTGDFYNSAIEEDALKYVPNIASSWFSFNGRSFKLEQSGEKVQAVYGKDDKPMDGMTIKQDSDITISCYSIGNNLEPIKGFLAHVRNKELKKQNDKTGIYRVHKNAQKGWAHAILKPVRNMDSVTMELATKTSLLQDVKTYLSERSKSWYSSRGIPWRRGYLLYGPPGTGKTSFASALAGHFGLNVYVISLSNPSLTDDLLDSLMTQLPSEKSVVLMEDIDSAGIQRSTIKEPGDSKTAKPGITLAGLLNCLDGPCSSEGRILIMTTNTPDSLDSALVRPGRIDRKILFGNASSEVVRTMFLHIFTDVPGESSTLSTDYDLAELAKSFASQVPEDRITPAELQNYLLEHRNSPLDAVDNVKIWVDALLLSKSQGLNVSQFADQIGDDEPAAVSALAAGDTVSETSDVAAGVDEIGEQTDASEENEDEGDDFLDTDGSVGSGSESQRDEERQSESDDDEYDGLFENI